MARYLVDESCARAIVDALRQTGADVTYAADNHRRAEDAALVALAASEDRIIVTEDFDFGELLVRRRLIAPGAVVLHLPSAAPSEKAARLSAVLQSVAELAGRLTIVSAKSVRQRVLR